MRTIEDAANLVARYPHDHPRSLRGAAALLAFVALIGVGGLAAMLHIAIDDAQLLWSRA